jgi:hypothetical protein
LLLKNGNVPGGQPLVVARPISKIPLDCKFSERESITTFSLPWDLKRRDKRTIPVMLISRTEQAVKTPQHDIFDIYIFLFGGLNLGI